MKSFIISLVLFTVLGANAATETKQYDASKVKTLIVKNSSGDIKIMATESAQATVVADKVKFSDNCEMTQKLDKSTLVIKVGKKRKSLFSWNDCKVHFNIAVAKKTVLKLRGGSSDLAVSGMNAPVEFKLGSGDVKLNMASRKVVGRTGSGSIMANGVYKTAKLKTGSGNINLKGLAGNAIVKTGSGNINVTYKKRLKKGTLQAKTGSGNAKLNVPKGMEMFAKLKSGSGSITNPIESNPKSNFKVSMKSGSGNIKVSTLK